jgi:hypothetical protein
MSNPTPQDSQARGALRQRLATIEHERWADWQTWCHKIIRDHNPSPEIEHVLERWDRQIRTPYSALSLKEKESDMQQVDRYWPLIEAYTERRATERAIAELEKMWTYRHYGKDYEDSMDELAEYKEKRIAELKSTLEKEKI